MSFNTAAKVPAMGSGGIPPAPPTQFQRGNTLFVSKTGDDATAAREDGIYVYDTIEAALAAAQAGDCIIIFPGTYQYTAPWEITLSLHIYCYPGVILVAEDMNAFNFTASNIIFSGDAVINLIGANSATYGIYNTGSNNYFELASINADKANSIGLVLFSGSCKGLVKNSITVNDNGSALFSVQGTHSIFINEITGTNTDGVNTTIVELNSAVADPGAGYANNVNLKFNRISCSTPLEVVKIKVGDPGGIGDKIILEGNVIENTYAGAGSSVLNYFNDAARPRLGDAVRLDLDDLDPAMGSVLIKSKLVSASGAGVYRFNISTPATSTRAVNAVLHCDIDAVRAFLMDANSLSVMQVNGLWKQSNSSEFGYSNASSQNFVITLTGKLDSYFSGAVIPVKIYNPSNNTDYPTVIFNCVIASANAANCIQSTSANAINITVYNLFATAPLDLNITELVSNSIIDVNVQ